LWESAGGRLGRGLFGGRDPGEEPRKEHDINGKYETTKQERRKERGIGGDVTDGHLLRKAWRINNEQKEGGLVSLCSRKPGLLGGNEWSAGTFGEHEPLTKGPRGGDEFNRGGGCFGRKKAKR